MVHCLSDFHDATVSCLVCGIGCNSYNNDSSYTATVRCVSVANKYWVVIYYNPQVLHQLSGLDFQAIYRVKSCVTGILLG